MKFDDLGAHDYKNDEYYTPEVALECLLDYVLKSSVVWDCTETSGNITGFFGRNESINNNEKSTRYPIRIPAYNPPITKNTNDNISTIPKRNNAT